MSNYNKVILVGNITRDLELRYIPSGTAVVKVGLAVNEEYRDKSGQRKEKTLFIDIDVWGRQAETLCEFAGKGRCILIEGTLEMESWTDKEGNKRSRHKVRCDRFQFMDSKQTANGTAPPAETRPRADSGAGTGIQGPKAQDRQPVEEQSDIPF